jgi:dolichol-phosphate mannosyltransferase
VIETIQPLLSYHFNLTVEMPLKAVVRGHSFAVVPISWSNRSHGTSKLGIQEMGSRYLFIVLYLFLERHLGRGDYHRSRPSATTQPAGDDQATSSEVPPADALS